MAAHHDFLIALMVTSPFSCAASDGDARTTPGTASFAETSPALGDPLPGLTVSERARFAAGRDAFEEVESVSDGLGPVFNDVSCAACHLQGAIGGASARTVTRFGRVSGGAFDPLAELGGSLIQSQGIGPITSGGQTCDYVAERVPAQANVVAMRLTTPLFGLGLVDAVPDATLVALAARQAADSPATAGRVNLVSNVVTGTLTVGKLGWKAQVPSLAQFAADAYLNEMGITSPLFPHENCPGGDCKLLACDPTPDPEDDGTDTRAFADFMMLLAPPARSTTHGQTIPGERIFGQIGCAACHVPALTTGSSAIAALDRVTFAPYSDFLLHDMGMSGDGIAQGQAGVRDMRTAPLWGLRARGVFLHDGSATSVTAAIVAHDGQGRAARDRFAALPAGQSKLVLAFLASL